MNTTIIERSLDALPAGYLLHWYELKHVIGRGGFGITYLAVDKNLHRNVAIKEYLPIDFASRNNNDTVHPVTDSHEEIFDWGLERFLSEARTLAKFNHPAIIRVVSVFEHNNTAYMVMEYEEGSNLASVKSSFTEEQILNIFVPITEGLDQIHKAGFIHRDIKPSNIYLRNDGSSVLLDFGSARQTLGTQTRALTTLVTAGYAPFEQYNESEEAQGPWTDIYSLGATAYYCMTGKKPADAMQRGGTLLKNQPDYYRPLMEMDDIPYSSNLKRAVDKALAFHAEERPQTALLWSQLLTGEIKTIASPESEANDFDDDLLGSDTVILRREDIRVEGSREDYTSATKLATPQPKQSAQDSATEDSDVESTLIEPKSSRTQDSGINVQANQAAPVNRRKAGSSDIRSSAQFSKALVTTIKAIQSTLLKLTRTVATGVITGITAIFNALAKSFAFIKLKFVAGSKQIYAALKTISTPRNAAIGGSAATLIGVIFGVIYFTSNASNTQIVSSEKPTRDSTSITDNVSLDETKTDSVGQTNQEPLITPENNPDQSIADTVNASQNITATAADNAKSDLVNNLLAQAQIDIANQRFTSPEKNNAVFRLNKVIALDPANTKAQDIFTIITNRYILRINTAIEEESWKQAKEQLAELHSMDKAVHSSETDESIKVLHSKLKKYNETLAKVAGILKRADKQLAQNNLTKPERDNALVNYKKALDIDPDNERAKKGLSSVVERLSWILEREVQKGHIKSAEIFYDLIQSADPDAPILAKVEPQIASIIAKRKTISKLLASAKQDFIRGNITTPSKNNAYSKYREVLKISPGNSQAQAGLDQIYEYFVSTYYRYLEEARFNDASKIVNSLRKIHYGKKQIAILRTKIQDEKENIKNGKATIELMASQLEKSLKQRDTKIIAKLSEYKTKDKSHFTEFFDKYSSFSVRVMKPEYDLRTKSAKSNVKFTNLVLDKLFGDKKVNEQISLDFTIQRNGQNVWKVVW